MVSHLTDLLNLAKANLCDFVESILARSNNCMADPRVRAPIMVINGGCFFGVSKGWLAQSCCNTLACLREHASTRFGTQTRSCKGTSRFKIVHNDLQWHLFFQSSTSTVGSVLSNLWVITLWNMNMQEITLVGFWRAIYQVCLIMTCPDQHRISEVSLPFCSN